MRHGSARRAFSTILGSIAASLVGWPAPAAPVDRWQWLQNTYWYVPVQYLPAIASNPNFRAPIPVTDQTVYHIDHYAAGYFWGITAVSYTRAAKSAASAPSCLQLVGSVTPEGRLHLTFTLLPTGGQSTSSTPTIGLGTMTAKLGAWSMENQMSTVAAGSILLTHWAYMYRCKPTERCFADLPGIGLSIPEFLAPCR